MSNFLTTVDQHGKLADPNQIWSDFDKLEKAMQVARLIASSDLVPKTYKDKPANVFLAMEMASRTGVGLTVVMQNLDIIDGRQSWKSTYVAARINECGRYKQLQYKYEDLGEVEVDYKVWEWSVKDNKNVPVAKKTKIRNLACTAYAERLSDGEIVHGQRVTVEMAVKDGWYFRANSKWPYMTEQMLAYRAATFFARLHDPGILIGLKTSDEWADIANDHTATNRKNNDSVIDNDPLSNLNASINSVDPNKGNHVEPSQGGKNDGQSIDDATIIDDGQDFEIA